MKRLIALILSIMLLVSGCSSAANKTNDDENQQKGVSSVEEVESSVDEIIEDEIITGEESIQEDSIPSFSGLDDPELLTYVTNNVYADLEYNFNSEDYTIENVEAVYLSKEYIDELTYNSQSNLYFGYTLEELDNIFEGSRYIFTLGEDGQTTVQKMDTVYNDSTTQIIKNVAVGGGVILLCVTVSVVTAGVGAPAVSMVFAASAKTATTFALSSSVIGGAASTITTAYQTHDVEAALNAGALAASEGFKWGAISGALIGGAKEAIALRKAAKAAKAAEAAANASSIAAENGANSAASALSEKGAARTWQESELAAERIFGGRSQVSFLNGKEVSQFTPGATRPDRVIEEAVKKVALEVKNYTLDNQACRAKLYSELEREIADRVANLPEGYLQKIVLDIQGKGYSAELIDGVTQEIWKRLAGIYPNIPICFI